MIGKKINQLATELAPVSTDLTIIGDPTTGVSKKITLAQLGAIFSGAVSFYNDFASFPATGDINVIYCAKDTKKLYLWSGSAYVEVFPSQALLDTYQLRSEKGNANGYASLDSSGKVPIGQLPSSIMEYKGTWSAATNTPTLANGTGDTGDVYLCNAAGTVNFGAGPLTFAVGDYVVYSGTIWQRSSGAVGTVTSVAASITGDAIGITGSPVTTSGTLAFAFGGNSTQYINGAGNLVTFPGVINEAQNLITEVYNKTGATLTKGTVVYINGGQGNLPSVTKALATGDSTSAQTYGIVRNDITNNNNGYVVVAGRISDLDTQAYTEGTQLYLSPTTAGTWTSTKPYAPNHLVYVGIVVRAHPTQGVVEIKIQNGYEMDELHNVAAQSPDNNDILQYKTATSLWTKVAGTTSNIAEGSNLYYTDARSRAALSFTAGSGAYNSTTGVITIPTNTNQLTNGAAFITLASLSAGAGISYNNTTGVIASTITQYTDAMARASISETVTGLDYNSTTGVLSLTSGYVIPTTTNETNWNAAYNDKINSAAVTGTTTKTLTLTQQDGGTITASWTDDNTDAVTSVFGRTGAVVAVSGDYNTSQVTENTNLYFTNARAIASTLTGYTSGAGTISATDTILSAIQKLNGNIGALTTGVSSVNGLTGAVTLTTSNIAEGTNLYYTEARVNANTNVAANTAARHNAVTIGTANGLSLSTQVLSLALASGSTTGALSSTDWNTFNNKQSALTNPVTGTGTTNYLPKFTGTSTIGNSLVFDNGTNVGIGTTSPTRLFDVSATNPQMTLKSTTTTGFSEYYFSDSAGDPGYLSYAHNGDYLVFGVNSAERMRITIGGNVGIGTTSPSQKLTVSGSTGDIIGITNGTATGYGYVDNNGFGLFTSASAGGTGIYYRTSNIIDHYINGSIAMRLNSTGNLGLGVTPSAWSLGKVIQVGSTTSVFNDANGSTYFGNNFNYNSNFLYLTSSYATSYVQQVDGKHVWNIAPSGTAGNTISFTQAMTLDASGNLMVGGTSVYGATITSYGSATRSGGIGIRNSAGTVAGFFGTYASGSGSGSTDIFAESAGFMAFASGGSERLRITSGGNVGIGNTSPGNLLTLYSASSAIYTQWVQSGTGTSSTDGLRIGLDASSNGIINLNEGTALITSIDGTERMRITSGGLVGIGTSSPTAPLTVAGNISLGNRASSGTSYIGKLREDNGGIANAYGIGFVNSDINGAGYINFYTTPVGGSGDTRMTITGAGNVGLGTTAPNSLLEVNRTITFSSIDTYGQLVVKTTSGANGRLLNIGVDETNGVSFIQSLNRGTDAMPLSLQRYGGAVLIGTTTEGFLGKLQVAGSVAITGQYNTVLPSSSFSYFDGSGQVVSSSSNASALYLDTTWNTTGNPDGIYLNVTNTASGASSKLLNLKVGSVSQFSVSKAGAIQTTAPSSGSAQPWKLGSYAAGGTGTATGVIYIEINGQIYSIPALQGTP